MVSHETARQALALVRQGKTAKQIGRALSINTGELYDYINAHPQFATAYGTAQREGLELWADELKESAFEIEDVMRARLHAENLRWLLARRLSDKYGDRLNVDVSGAVDLVGVLADARARLLPVSDQRAAAIAQDAEFTELAPPMRTDYQSVAKPEPLPAPLPPELE